ncbi:cyclin-O [Spea bombifrons]|uniref:cyclin-O n=1 Tax=Spea bombifrons TaxID=233779 RepID=UPI0023493B91|nr:cyclin-O [Spea bombifrons]
MLPKQALPPHSPISTSKRKRRLAVTVTPEGWGDGSPPTGSSAASPRAKKPKYLRHRKQRLELRSCDSGVCDLQDTPSPALEASWRLHDPLDTCPWTPDRLGLQTFREYGRTCYLFKKSLETNFLPVDCLENQPQLKADSRCKLISWLIPVHRHFGLGFESLCLAVNILDRFLSCMPVASDCFQLVGVTSLLIACKQVETRPPPVKHLLALCGGAFSHEQLCNLEYVILLKLRFSLGAPTINFFLQHFTLQRITDGDLTKGWKTLPVARAIAELCLADYAFNSYSPSLMAICCLAVADRMLCQDMYVETGGFHYDLLKECMDKIDLLVTLNQDSLHHLLPGDLRDKSMDVDS